LIDVGANVGLIVRMAEELGYAATGIEVNEAAVEHARAQGLDMVCAPLEDAELDAGSIDVIVLSATAEHIEEIDEIFSVCRELLRSGGLLYVSNSPNWRSFGARTERDLWYGIQPTGHVWQLTPRTLREILERTGFHVVAQRTYNLHRDFGRNRKQRIKKQLFRAAAALGLGDALGMAGVRP
jgi:SAM-dependent methyltransferase